MAPQATADPYENIATPAAAQAAPAASASDPYASIAVPIAKAPSFLDVPPKPVVAPPNDHKEEIVRGVAGDPGLSWYRAAREAVNQVEKLIASPSTAYADVKDGVKQAILNIPAVVKSNFMPEPYDLNPAHHVLRDQPVIPVPGLSAAVEAFAADSGAAAATSAGSTLRVNPFRQIIQGKAVAQEPAAAAIRGAVGAAADTPILEGAETVVDKPISDLAAQTKAAYKKVDDAVGFDLKEAKAQLKNDQYNLKQLGNTPADQATRKTLQASIADSTDRVTQAESKLTAAGIDPREADALNTAQMAGKDFKNAVIRSTSPDGSINVDKLLNQSKVLRFSKRGDRLAQFMKSVGSDPDEFMKNLAEAQAAGVHAVKVQKLAEWIGGGIAGTIGAGAVAEGIAKAVGR